jgi:hypothetical protein
MVLIICSALAVIAVGGIALTFVGIVTHKIHV